MSLSSGSPGLTLFRMPSNMAISMALKARYGLPVGSGKRYSTRRALGWAYAPGCGSPPSALAADRKIAPGRRIREPSLVGIGRRVGERAQRGCVFEQAADGILQRYSDKPA